jgi:hypothetical protein
MTRGSRMRYSGVVVACATWYVLQGPPVIANEAPRPVIATETARLPQCDEACGSSAKCDVHCLAGGEVQMEYICGEWDGGAENGHCDGDTCWTECGPTVGCNNPCESALGVLSACDVYDGGEGNGWCTSCGDRVCDPGSEGCSTCPQDCGQCPVEQGPGTPGDVDGGDACNAQGYYCPISEISLPPDGENLFLHCPYEWQEEFGPHCSKADACYGMCAPDEECLATSVGHLCVGNGYDCDTPIGG